MGYILLTLSALILLIIMTAYAWHNNDWSEYCKQLNDEWSEYCKQLNDEWSEYLKMINFIFCIVMSCYALYINYSWYKDYNKLNDRWGERYNELNKKLVDICQKIREEKNDD